MLILELRLEEVEEEEKMFTKEDNDILFIYFLIK